MTTLPRTVGVVPVGVALVATAGLVLAQGGSIFDGTWKPPAVKPSAK